MVSLKTQTHKENKTFLESFKKKPHTKKNLPKNLKNLVVFF